MANMTEAEAIQTASHLVKFLRKFEGAEETLRMAIAAQATVNDLTADADKLRVEIRDAGKAILELSARNAELEEARIQRLEEINKEANKLQKKKTVELDELVNARTQKITNLESEIVDVETRLKQASDAFDASTLARKEELDKLTAGVKRLKNQADSIGA